MTLFLGRQRLGFAPDRKNQSDTLSAAHLEAPTPAPPFPEKPVRFRED
jgi:hypothetical protein